MTMNTAGVSWVIICGEKNDREQDANEDYVCLFIIKLLQKKLFLPEVSDNVLKRKEEKECPKHQLNRLLGDILL